MTTASSQTRETEEEKRRKSLLPLFLLLLFFLLTTSCIVGFLLGRTTEPGRFGALIDTVVLSPDRGEPTPAPTGAAESPVAEGVAQRIILVGLVRYTDGVPFTDGSVRLQSEPRYSQLTDQGHFRFDQVEVGTHELAVLDRTGSVLARRTIEVERDAEADAYMEYEQEVCVMHIKLLTVEVDIEITLGDEPGGLMDVKLLGTREEDQLALRPTQAPAETGGAGPDSSGVPAQFPSVPPEETGQGVPSTAPIAEPSAEPAGGPNTEPTASQGAVTTENPSAAPGPGESPVPTASPAVSPTATPKPSRRPSDDDDDDDDHGGGGGGGSAVDPPAPTKPPAAGDTQVYDEDSGKSWTQQTEIDLFRPLDGSDHRIIAPGSEGYYVFRLKNGRNEPIHFTLALQEGNFHIPLVYRITTDELIPKGLTDWQTARLDAASVSKAVSMEADGEKRFRIEWRWPFEGNDGVDTTLGQRDDRTYTLKLTIRVEGET